MLKQKIRSLLKGIPIKVTNLAPELQTGEAWRYPRLLSRVTEKELDACVELIREHLGRAYLAPTGEAIRTWCAERILPEGLFLEFGVFKAVSTNFFAEGLKARKDPRLVHG